MLRKKGPEIDLLQFHVESGLSTGVNQRLDIGIHGGALSAFTLDSQNQMLYIIPSAPPLRLHKFELSDTGATAAGDFLLQGPEAGEKVQNLWNVVAQEGSQSPALLALSPSAQGFNSTVYRINVTSGELQPQLQLQGAAIRSLVALDRRRHRYFVVVLDGSQRFLVNIHLPDWSTQQFPLSVENLVGIHYEDANCRLLAVYLRAPGVLSLREIDLENGVVDPQEVTAVSPAVSLDVEGYEMIGMTSLTSSSFGSHLLVRDPHTSNVVIFRLEDGLRYMQEGSTEGLIGLAPSILPQPIFSTLSPTTAAQLGGSTVEITGLDLGLRDLTPQLSFGGAAAQAVFWISDSSINAQVGPGTGTVAVSVNVHGQEVDMKSAEISFVMAWSSVSPSQASVVGGTTLTLAGGFFVENQGDYECYFGSHSRTPATVTSGATAVECPSPLWPFSAGPSTLELLLAGKPVKRDASGDFIFLAGAADHLMVQSAPSSASGGEFLDPPVEIAAKDSAGNTAMDFSGTIYLSVFSYYSVTYNATNATNSSTAMLVSETNVSSSIIKGQTAANAANGVATFLFSIDRHGKYLLVFSNCSCSSSCSPSSQPMSNCLWTNTTIDVLVGSMASVISSNFPATALAGLAVLPEPILQILDSGGNIANVSLPISASIVSEAAVDFSATTIVTQNGQGKFTDLKLNQLGFHTLNFKVQTAGGPAVNITVEVVRSPPTFLYNRGGNPFGVVGSMEFLDPFPSVWVLDAGRNRILDSYWIQDPYGVKALRHLDVTIEVNITSAFESTSLFGAGDSFRPLVPPFAMPFNVSEPSGRLFGANRIRLVGNPNAVAECPGQSTVMEGNQTVLTNCSGHGVCMQDATCSCFSGWRGEGCWLPTEDVLCGEACDSGIGYWANETCFCQESGFLTTQLSDAANFTELLIDLQGKGYVLLFTSPNIGSARSFVFTITTGQAHHLWVISHPTNPGGSGGSELVNAPVVQVRDAGKNPITSHEVGANASIVVELVDGDPAATLFGILNRTATDGIAFFDGLVIDKAVSLTNLYRLKFTAPGLLETFTEPFQIEIGPPAKMQLLAQPANGNTSTGGLPFGTQPQLELLDLGGNRVTQGSSNTVSASLINPSQNETCSLVPVAPVLNFTMGGNGTNSSNGSSTANVTWTYAQNCTTPSHAGVLEGTQTVNFINGIAQFLDLAIDFADTGYKILFAPTTPGFPDPSSLTSLPFDVVIGPVARLVLLQSPASASGGLLDPQPVLELEDEGRNRVLNSPLNVSVNVTRPGIGNSFSGFSFESEQGIVNTPGLVVTQQGLFYQFIFYAPSKPQVPSVTTDPFNNTVGAPAKIIVIAQVGNILASGDTLSLDPAIQLLDQGDNTLFTDDFLISVKLDYSTFVPDPDTVEPIELQLACNTSDFVVPNISGTTQKLSVAGQASFTDISVTRAGSGYRLEFLGDGLLSAKTATFSVARGDVATQVHVVCQPFEEKGGEPFFRQPVIDFLDSGGNRLKNKTRAVTVSMVSNIADSILTGTFTSIEIGDLVTFTDLAIDKAADGYVLRFEAAGLASDDSQPFRIVPGDPVAVSATIMNLPVESGEAILTDASLRDKGGNVATGASARNVTATLYTLKSYERVLRCTGTHSCIEQLNTSVPEGAILHSTNLSIQIACTDFDYETEKVVDIKVGDYSLTAGSEYKSGPFEGCFRDCLSTRYIVEGYDTVRDVCLDTGEKACYKNLYSSNFLPFETRYNHLNTLRAADPANVNLQIEISPDVNFHPCDGFLLNTWITYKVVYAVPSGDQLSGTSSLSTGNGTAWFRDLSLGIVDREYLIGFSADGLSISALTQLFTVMPGPVRILRLLTQPGNGTGNTILDPQPKIELLDNAMNRVAAASGPSFTVNAVLLQSGTYVDTSFIVGLTSMGSSNGIALFTDLLVGPRGTNYMLEFSYGVNLSYPVRSSPFKVEVGNAYRLSIVQQPLFGVGGTPFTQQPIIQVLDWSNNDVATNGSMITVAIQDNGAIVGTLSGNLLLYTVSGRVIYTDLSINLAGEGYTLSFSSANLVSVESSTFAILKGNATRLGMVRQPSSGQVSMMLSSQPAVAVQDAGGNIITGWAGTVSVVIGVAGRPVHPGLVLNSTVNLIGITNGFMFEGVAYFGNLKLDRQGIGFVLNFTANGLEGVQSDPFDIYGGAATHLKVLALPTIARTIINLPESVVVALDENGNVDSGFASEVNLNLLLGPEETAMPRLVEGTSVSFSNGLASFTSLQVVDPSLQLRFNFSSGGFSVLSDPFDVINQFSGIWNMYFPASEPPYTQLSMGLSSSGVASAAFTISPGATQLSYLSGFKATEDLARQCKSVGGSIRSNSEGLGGAYFENCEQGGMTGLAATKVSQTLSPNVTYARDILSLQVEEYLPRYAVKDYIVVANGFNGSTYSVDAAVYQWENGVLVFHHHISGTKGAHDIEHFVLGGAHYLIVANHFDDSGVGFGAPSLIYMLQWSQDKQKYVFQPVQSISTAGAVAWETFVIGGKTYAAVANYFNGSHFDINSKIFRLDRTEGDTAVPRTIFLQAFATQGARDVAFFDGSAGKYLAYANRFGAKVAIYQWSMAQKMFLWLQNVEFSAPMHLAPFTISGNTFLAVANFATDGASSGAQNMTSILKLNPSSNSFELSQEISGAKTSFVTTFQENDDDFVLVVNAPVSGASGSVDVYKWDGTQIRPYFALPIEYTYAVAMASIPCNITSVRGVSCGNNGFDQVIVTGNGWGVGLDVLELFSLNATILATHLMVTSPGPDATIVNQTLLPPTHAQLQNFDKNVTVSWTQPVTADIAILSQNVAVGSSTPFVATAAGDTTAYLDANGVVTFDGVISTQAGNQSVRVGSPYLSDVQLARTSIFSLAAGSPARLQVQSFPTYLVSGTTLDFVLSVHDAFGNFQPESPVYSATASAFGNTTTIVPSDTITIANGKAMVSMLLDGNELDGQVSFAAPGLTDAVSSPFDIAGRAWFQNFSFTAAMPGASIVSSSAGILIFGGTNSSGGASNLVTVMTANSFPYHFTSDRAVSGALPAARTGHSAVMISLNGQETMAVIGGTTNSGVAGDAYALDVATFAWSDLSATDTGGRSDHGAVFASQIEGSGALNMIIVFGGMNAMGQIIADLRIYRIFLYTVGLETAPSQVGTPPTPRKNFMMAWQGQTGYIFGGEGIEDSGLYSFTVDRSGSSYTVKWSAAKPGIEGGVRPAVSLVNTPSQFQSKFYMITKMSDDSMSTQFSALDVERYPARSWLPTVVMAGTLPSPEPFTLIEVGVGKVVLFPRNWTGAEASATLMSLVPSHSLMLDSDLTGVTGTAGIPLPVQPLVSIRDITGNVVKGYASDATVSVLAVDSLEAPVALGGRTSMQASSGLAQFTDLSIDKNTSGVILRFSSNSLHPVGSSPLSVTRGPAAKIEILTQPSGIFFGEVFFVQPAAEIRDIAGNRVFEDSYSVLTASLDLQIGADTYSDQSANLQGTKSLTAVRGRVQYTDLTILSAAAQGQSNPVFRIKIQRAGVLSGITEFLSITAPADTTPTVLSTFTGATVECVVASDIHAGQCGSALPTNTGVAGVPFTVQPVIRLQVTGSNLLYLEANKAITATLRRVSNDSAIPNGFTGSTTALTSQGYANFTDLAVTKIASDFIISFEGADGFSRVDTARFAVVPGQPRNIDITRQVSGAAAGEAFTQQPRLVITDSNGNLVSSATPVTAQLLLNDQPQALKGNPVVSTSSGVASFTNLAVDRLNLDYKLLFTIVDACCGKNDTALSDGFNVSGSTPAKLAESTTPSSATANIPFPVQPVVSVQDAGGNPITTVNGTTVTASIEKDDTLRFNLLQGIGVAGVDVVHLEPFEANGTRYVAAAISYDGTSYSVDSKLYYWNPVTELLEPIQDIPSEGAQYWKHVQRGDRHFLFLANSFQQVQTTPILLGTYLTNSKIFEMQNGRLVQLETFATEGAKSVESFEISGQTYILVANSFNDSSVNVRSKLYSFNESQTPSLRLLQSIYTSSANIWHHFQDSTGDYVVAGLYYDLNAASYTANSVLYELSGGLLVPILTFETQGVVRIESFSVHGRTYLAVANSIDSTGATEGGSCVIYEFAGGALVEAQSFIGLKGITDMAYFHLNDQDWLALGSNPLDNSQPSMIVLNWDNSNCTSTGTCSVNFTQFTKLSIDDCRSVTHFKEDAKHYLIYGGNTGLDTIAFFSNAKLTGTLEVPVINGYATFTDLSINLAQDVFKLRYEAVGLTSAVGAGFALAVGNPTSLSFLRNPAVAVGGEAFVTQPIIAIVDSGGNRLKSTPSGAEYVTATIESTGEASALRGTSTVSTSAAVATFTDLGLDRATWTVISFNASNFAGVKVNMTVVAGGAYKLSVLTSGALAYGGIAFGTQPVLGIVDRGGNLVTSDSSAKVGVSGKSVGDFSATALVGTSMVAATSAASRVFTDGGENKVLVSSESGSVYVYGWGCSSLVTTATIMATSPSALETFRFGNWLWLAVVSSSQNVVEIFAYDTAGQKFAMVSNQTISGDAHLNAAQIGGRQFLLVGTVVYEFSRTAQGTPAVTDDLITLSVIQNITLGFTPNRVTLFEDSFIDYMVVASGSSLQLYMWNGYKNMFGLNSSYAQGAADVLVYAAGQNPVMVYTDGATAAVVNLRAGPGSVEINAVNMGAPADTISALGSNSKIAHHRSGSTHVLAFTSASGSTTNIYKGDGLTYTLVWATASTGYDTLSFFNWRGNLYLAGAGASNAVYLIEGTGSLSGTTTVVASNGQAAFTDLSLDLVGDYELEFLPLSLDAEYENHLQYESASVNHNVSVGFGTADGLVPASSATVGDTPAVMVIDAGGNNLTTADGTSVRAVLDNPSQYSNLTDSQQLSSTGARDVNHFLIGTTHFLAIANNYDGSSYTIDSVILKWVGSSAQFLQSLETKGAYDFESFSVSTQTVTGTGPNNKTTVNYLAVANHYDDVAGSYVTNSVIYRWNSATQVFDSFQNIETTGATHWEAFTIDNVAFLAIANFFDGTFHSVNSVIYKYSATYGNFSKYQELPTVGAHHISYISEGGKHFLVIAQFRASDEVSLASSSLLYRWDEATAMFTKVASFGSSAAMHVETFRINDIAYVAVANYANNTDGDLNANSYIYKLECLVDTDRMTLVQEIPTEGAAMWKYFQRAGNHYLAVSHWVPAVLNSNRVVVYLWDGSQFVSYSDSASTGAFALEFMFAEGGYYSLQANPGDPSSQVQRFVRLDGGSTFTQQSDTQAVSGGKASFSTLDSSITAAASGSLADKWAVDFESLPLEGAALGPYEA